MRKNYVTHLITGLGKGGAETMLYQILKYKTDLEMIHRVVSLGASHFFERPMREMGYEVTELAFFKRPLSSFVKLCGELKKTDTLCCWMYHANFIGYLAGCVSGVKRIIWSVRHSNLNDSVNKRTTQWVNRICARWSKNVSAILYNGACAREVHEAIGYCQEKGAVVDNGCDCEEYRPDGSAGVSLRKELGIPEDKKIILSVTKATPVKDVPTFLKAYGKLLKQEKGLAAVLCGPGVERDNTSVAEQCRAAGVEIGRDVFLLGMRHDVPRLLAGCDLYVLHSAGEAFPNALLQAMACGCVCVSTDVGDARRILNRDACVVPSENAQALAEKMAELLALPEKEAEVMRNENRARVRREFDIREIVKIYERWYEQ